MNHQLSFYYYPGFRPSLLSVFTGQKYALSPQRPQYAQHWRICKLKLKFEASTGFQILLSIPPSVSQRKSTLTPAFRGWPWRRMG